MTFSGPAIIDELSMSRLVRNIDRAARQMERRLYG